MLCSDGIDRTSWRWASRVGPPQPGGAQSENNDPDGEMDELLAAAQVQIDLNRLVARATLTVRQEEAKNRDALSLLPFPIAG